MDFKAFHQRYYHPSNARLFFYGDDDPDERLRLLDAWLSAFQAIRVESLPGLQPRFTAPKHVTETYMAGGDEPSEKRGMLTLSWMLDEIVDAETRLGLQILAYVLA